MTEGEASRPRPRRRRRTTPEACRARRPTPLDLERAAPFVDRHIGPSDDDQAKMLAAVGRGSLDELVDAARPPASIRDADAARAARAATEAEVLAELRALAGAQPGPTCR